MSFRFDLCSVFFPSLFFFVKNEIPLLLRGFPLVPPPPLRYQHACFFSNALEETHNSYERGLGSL